MFIYLGLRWLWEIATVASLLRNDMFIFSFTLNDRIPCHLERSGAQSKDLGLSWCGDCLGLRWHWGIATVASLLRNDMFIYLVLRWRWEIATVASLLRNDMLFLESGITQDWHLERSGAQAKDLGLVLFYKLCH